MPEPAHATTQSAVWLTRTQLVLLGCLALGLLLAIAAYAWEQSRRESRARTMVIHTLVVLKQALELENAAIVMETNQRAYLISGQAWLLARRDASHDRAVQLAGKLAALVGDDPPQVLRVQQSVAALHKRYLVMQETSALVASAGLPAARTRFQVIGDGSIEPMRKTLAVMQQEEQRLLAARTQVSDRDHARFELLLVAGTSLAFAILIAAGFVLLRQLAYSVRLGVRLAQSSEQLKFAYEVSQIGDWDLDLRSGLSNRSLRHDQIFGHDALLPEWRYDIFLDYVHPEDRERVDVAFKAAVETGEDWNFECRIFWQDQSLHWISACGRVFERTGGHPTRMLGTVADITQRKHAENERAHLAEQQRDSEAQVRLLLDSTAEAIYGIDADGHCTFSNRACARLLGYADSQDLLGKEMHALIHYARPDGTPYPVEECRIYQAVRANTPVHVDDEALWRADGTSFAAEYWSYPILRHGKLVGAVVTFLDISQRKQAEANIQALNTGLLANAEQLKQANRELESFSYSVSHDLRAPLRHIDGYARMLAEDAADQLQPEAQRYLQTIIASARRMGLLIDDLLTFSRLGRKPLARQQVNMGDLVESVMAEIRTSSNSAVHIDIAALPSVEGDPALLRQVWANLLSNAVKYSAPRGEQARIVVAGERKGDHMHYLVRDNGVGFDMRYADKLFGVFQRLHAQDQFEGTGVGLAIVQRIVSRHGGQVSATAEVDRGACFTFELPISEAVA